MPSRDIRVGMWVARATCLLVIGITSVALVACQARKRSVPDSPELQYAAKPVKLLPRGELVPQHLDTSWAEVEDLGCHRGVCDSSHYGRSALWTDGTHALFSVGLRIALVDLPAKKLLWSWQLAPVELGVSLVPAWAGDAQPATKWVALGGTDALTLAPDRQSVLALDEFSLSQIAIVRFDASSRNPVATASCFVPRGRPGLARFSRDAAAAFIQRDGQWLRCRADAPSRGQPVPPSLVPDANPWGYDWVTVGRALWTVSTATTSDLRTLATQRLNSITQPVWSADGLSVLTQPTSTTVELFSREGLREFEYTIELGTPIDQVTFMGSDRLAAGMSSSLDIWNHAESSIVQTFRYVQPGAGSTIYPYPPHSKLLYTKAGDLISIRNMASPPILRWSKEQGEMRFYAHSVSALSAFAVGAQILYAPDDSPPVWLRDLDTGRPVKRLPLPIFELMTPTLSHSGAIVAGWSAQGEMSLHRARPTGEFNEQPALRWAPSGELLLGARGPAEHDATPRPNPALSPDARLLAWASERQIIVARTSDGAIQLRKRIDVTPWYLDFDPSGQWLAWTQHADGHDSVVQLSITDGSYDVLEFPLRLTSNPALSEDGRWLAVGTFDGLVLTDRLKRTWQHLSRIERQPTALGVACAEDGSIRGSPDARRAAWMRTSTDLLGSLVPAL